MITPLLFQSLGSISNSSKGMLGSILNLGMLFSAGGCGRMADKRGRVPIFKAGGYLLLLGLVMMILVESLNMITLALLVVGVGIGA